MTTIPTLNDHELLEKTQTLVKEEKRITQLVLDYLQEIDARKLYAKRGFSSLFSFCTEFLGYSESAAYRRISAMRLLRSLPEAKRKLEAGSVNLSTLSQLQSFIHKEEKSNRTKLDLEEKRELLGTIENKSQHECEREFAKRNPETIKRQKSQQPVSEQLTKITFVANEKLVQKLERLKELLSNKNMTSLAEVIEESVDHAIEDLEPKMPKANPITSSTEVRNDTNSQGGSVASRNLHTRYIPAAVKREVWHRDQGRCQFIDSITSKKCGSRYALHYDHTIPFCRGGKTTANNLRLLCRVHNRVEAERILGSKVMAKYIAKAASAMTN